MIIIRGILDEINVNISFHDKNEKVISCLLSSCATLKSTNYFTLEEVDIIVDTIHGKVKGL